MDLNKTYLNIIQYFCNKIHPVNLESYGNILKRCI